MIVGTYSASWHQDHEELRVTARWQGPLPAADVSPQSADASESENATLGISFIGLANGPEALVPTSVRKRCQRA
jgi:hypothetical protein